MTPSCCPSTAEGPAAVGPPVDHARRWLGQYFAAVVAVTFVHDPRALATLLILALAASGAARWRLLRRTLLAVLVFNLSVSLGYVAMSLWQGAFRPSYLVVVNLRVLLLVFLGFWFVSRVNLLQALSFSPTLCFLATLAVGQVMVFSRVLRDFRLAFVSRNPGCPRWRDRARNASAQAAHLLDKSVASAAESGMAMRSRGCFDD
ncbi:ABC transporter permease [Methylibium sp. Pch-M]|uniref:ABC transporter permease n=1 Tax=Methylibium sp. Pch-M TaxID=2082386 RepID=UPI001012A9F6|nr:ABC transporter permease [Methylibium sp. Pch-M]QAZ38607.1 ABC transporter permease [Methylibium sp. Pch-M]